MYDSIGVKIKMLAKILFWLEVVASFIAFVILLVNEITEIALIVIAVGPALSLFLSWFMYGFGEIIDKLQQIEENTRQTVPTTPQGERKMPQGVRKKGQHKSTPKGMPRTESVPQETQEIPSEKKPEETSSVEEDEYTECTFSTECPKCKQIVWYQEENMSFDCPYCDYFIDTKKKK